MVIIVREEELKDYIILFLPRNTRIISDLLFQNRGSLHTYQPVLQYLATTHGSERLVVYKNLLLTIFNTFSISMRSMINWFGLYIVLCSVNVAGLDLVNSLFGGGSLGGSHHKPNISTSHGDHSIAVSSPSGGNHAAASVKVLHFILTPAWGATARWILFSFFLSFSTSILLKNILSPTVFPSLLQW